MPQGNIYWKPHPDGDLRLPIGHFDMVRGHVCFERIETRFTNGRQTQQATTLLERSVYREVRTPDAHLHLLPNTADRIPPLTQEVEHKIVFSGMRELRVLREANNPITTGLAINWDSVVHIPASILPVNVIQVLCPLPLQNLVSDNYRVTIDPSNTLGSEAVNISSVRLEEFDDCPFVSLPSIEAFGASCIMRYLYETIDGYPVNEWANDFEMLRQDTYVERRQHSELLSIERQSRHLDMSDIRPVGPPIVHVEVSTDNGETWIRELQRCIDGEILRALDEETQKPTKPPEGLRLRRTRKLIIKEN